MAKMNQCGLLFCALFWYAQIVGSLEYAVGSGDEPPIKPSFQDESAAVETKPSFEDLTSGPHPVPREPNRGEILSDDESVTEIVIDDDEQDGGNSTEGNSGDGQIASTTAVTTTEKVYPTEPSITEATLPGISNNATTISAESTKSTADKNIQDTSMPPGKTAESSSSKSTIIIIVSGVILAVIVLWSITQFMRNRNTVSTKGESVRLE